jgi:hypothetical protein
VEQDYVLTNVRKYHSDYQDLIEFRYSRLSPWWAVSSITTSLVYGMVRCAATQVLSYPERVFNLFYDVEWDRVKEVLNTVDTRRAKSIYRTHLLPFWSHCSNADNFFRYDSHKEVLNHLIDVGINSVFKPELATSYWEAFSDSGRYGWRRFVTNVRRSHGSYNRFSDISVEDDDNGF